MWLYLRILFWNHLQGMECLSQIVSCSTANYSSRPHILVALHQSEERMS